MKKIFNILLVSVQELFSSKKYKERKKDFTTHFKDHFTKWKEKGYYYPVSEPGKLRNWIVEDIQVIAESISSAPSNINKLRISINMLHIKNVTEKAWVQLVNEFFNNFHYSFSIKDGKVLIHFGFPKEDYL